MSAVAPSQEKLISACKLTLLFHSGSPWTDDKRLEWANLLTEILGPASARDSKVVGANGDGTWDGATPTNEATTKNLCNAARKALEPFEGLTPLSSYAKTKAHLETLPMTWYPALIVAMVEAAYFLNVFNKPDGASKLIAKVEAQMEQVGT